MPNVVDYNITNTPIDNMDNDTAIYKMKLSNTTLTAFSGWGLNYLQ
jgi:hypothetical protein